MKIKEYLKKNKGKIKYGLILINSTIIAYGIGKYIGISKATIFMMKPLSTFLSKEDYIKFYDHFTEFYNIKRG